MFNKTDDFIWSVNVVISLMFVMSVGMACLYLIFVDNPSIFLINILRGLGIATCVAAIGFKIAQNFTYKTLPGKFNGELVFYKDKIVIGNKEVKLAEIKQVDIVASDYNGMRERMPSEVNLNPLLSNGVDNSFKIWLLNGGEITVNFQQENKNQVTKANALLVEYYSFPINVS